MAAAAQGVRVKSAYVEVKPELDGAGLDRTLKAAAEHATRIAVQVMNSGLGNLSVPASQLSTPISNGIQDGIEDGAQHANSASITQPIANNIQTAAAAGLTAGLTAGAQASSDGIGKKIGTGIKVAGLAALAAIGMGAKEALEREAGNDSLAASLGATPEESAKYGKVAGAVYAQNYGESVEAVNNTIAAIIRNTSSLTTDQFDSSSLEDYTAKMLTMESIFGESSLSITRAATKMVQAGIVENFDEALDVLTRGLQSPLNGSEDLLDSFNEYSVVFGDLGLSAQQGMGLMSQALAGGARDTDIVSDAFKEMRLQIAGGSDANKDALASIGINWQDAAGAISAGGEQAAAMLGLIIGNINALEDPAARAAAQVGIFGTAGEDMASSFGNLNLSTAAAEIDNVADSAERLTATAGDNIISRFEALKRSVTSTFIEQIGPIVLPILEKMAGFFERNAEWIAPLVSGVIALAAVTWGINTAVAAHTAVQAAWTTVTGLATGAQWGLNAAMLANPIGIVLVALVALVAAGAWFFTQTEMGRKVWENLINFVSGAMEGWALGFSAAGQAFTNYIVNPLKTAWNWAKNLWEMLKKIPGMGGGSDKGGGLSGILSNFGPAGAIAGAGLKLFGMADGGNVAYQPGGTPIIVGEKRPESVTDSKTLNSLLAGTNSLVDTVLSGGNAGSGGNTFQITINPTPGMSAAAIADAVFAEASRRA